MLFSPKQSWSWSVSNNTTYTTAAFGTSLTPGTNTKGSWVECLAATAQDAYEVVVFGGYTAATGALGYLFDVGVDPAGGTSYQVLIPDLAMSKPSFINGGNWYGFPVYIPKGSSVAMRCQVNTGTTAVRMGIQLKGQPSRPDAIQVGSFVRAFNVDTATSFGSTAVTATGSGVEGAWTQIGTLADRLWHWNLGITLNNSAFTKNQAYFVDLAVGDASNKILVIDDASFALVDNETACNGSPQDGDFEAPSGALLYARATHTGTVLTGFYVTAYGVGG